MVFYYRAAARRAAGQGSFGPGKTNMAKRARRSTGLMMLSMSELHAEMRRRQRKVATVQRRRDRLAAKLNRLDDLIRDMGGHVNGFAGPRKGRVGAIPGRKRPRNESNLADALAKVLRGRT